MNTPLPSPKIESCNKVITLSYINPNTKGYHWPCRLHVSTTTIDMYLVSPIYFSPWSQLIGVVQPMWPYNVRVSTHSVYLFIERHIIWRPVTRSQDRSLIPGYYLCWDLKIENKTVSTARFSMAIKLFYYPQCPIKDVFMTVCLRPM